MDDRRSVHDNLLLSYSVLAREREIRLHPVFLGGELREYTDVVFSDVVAYHFERDNFQTVLLDVTEESLEVVYDKREDLFREGHRYDWPTKHGSSEELLRRLRAGRHDDRGEANVKVRCAGYGRTFRHGSRWVRIEGRPERGFGHPPKAVA